MSQSVAASPAAAGQTNQPRTKKQKTQQDAEDAIEAEPHTVDSDAEEDEDPAAVEVVADPSSDSESSDDDADASASNSDSNSDSDSDSDVPSKSVVSNLTTQTRQLQFRNYTPHDTSLRISKVSNIDLQKDNEWMDKELQEVIENALNNEDDDKSLLSIVPKPLNWDLKRDLAPRLAELNTKTSEKIREILSKQIEQQKMEEGSASSSSSSESDSDSSSSSDEEGDDK